MPSDAVSGKSRNGRIERALSVPLEDMRDGYEESGQVGQELYGAGMPFVYTSRHYRHVPQATCLAYSSYPMYDFAFDTVAGDVVVRWRAGGDPRCSFDLRVIPLDPDRSRISVSVNTMAASVCVALRGARTVEGHAAFAPRGGQSIAITWSALEAQSAHAVQIGSLPVPGHS